MLYCIDRSLTLTLLTIVEVEGRAKVEVGAEGFALNIVVLLGVEGILVSGSTPIWPFPFTFVSVLILTPVSLALISPSIQSVSPRPKGRAKGAPVSVRAKPEAGRAVLVRVG